MKKLLAIIMMMVLVFSLTACGNKAESNDETVTTKSSNSSPEEKDATEQTSEEENADNSESMNSEISNVDKTDKKTLIAYFSATGTTKSVGESIAELTNGDAFEIVPADSYTSDDLDYNDDDSRTTKEQNDSSSRPEISNTIEKWDEYSVVFIGYPIWWGEEPRILDTFVESYDFTGKTVIPFCTSGGSGVGSSEKNLASLAVGDGTWVAGSKLSSNDDLSNWLKELNLGY